MDDELSDLLQPITLNWRESELKRWTEDYSIDHDVSSNFYWLRGRMHISLCDTATICFIGERLPDGNIRLIPWPDDPARYSLAAVAELRRWREALAAAGGMSPIQFDPTALGIRAKRLGIRPDTLERWDNIRTKYYPKGLTQASIAELETLDTETIRKDFKQMRKKGLLPPK